MADKGTGKDMQTETFSDTNRKLDRLAAAVLNNARNTLLIHLRFMARAVSMLQLRSMPGLGGVAVNRTHISYDPAAVLKSFTEEAARPARQYLHMVLHCVYRHFWISTLVDRACWDLACDIAVEYTINDLGIPSLYSCAADRQMQVIRMLSSKVKYMTAELLYRYFLTAPPGEETMREWQELFAADLHDGWYFRKKKEQAGGYSAMLPAGSDPCLREWKETARQMKMDLESFSKEKGEGSGCLVQNLAAVTRERYDYAAFLRKFAVRGERMKLNMEEFDYVFYTYGLQLYGRMPLIEPLEYRDVKQVREIVIALDTSGSTAGALVRTFVQKTYNILKGEENFFTRFNLHIIQCDSTVTEDVKIETQHDFDVYLANMKILGGGGTDFRPVFSYVNRLIAAGEFSNLRGMIYFTDGYGTFPSRPPAYQTAFVYIDDGYNNPKVPAWAIRLVLQPEDIEEIRA